MKNSRSSYIQRVKRDKVKRDAEVLAFKDRLSKFRESTCESKLQSLKIKFQRIIKEIQQFRKFDRFWVHVDLDMFYAAVEMRDNPDLKDKPIAVGQKAICTSNYLARRFGVRSGMPAFVARRLCPSIVITEVNMDKYQIASEKFLHILREYDPDVESFGLDEGKMDLTNYMSEHNIPKDEHGVQILMKEIRGKIESELNITASSGCSNDPILAKLCSDINKPNGQFFLKRTEEAILSLLNSTKVGKISGLGRQLEYLLNGIGIVTMGDLRIKLFKLFCIWSRDKFIRIASRAYGISLFYNDSYQEKKSISCSKSWPKKPNNDPKKAWSHLKEYCKSLESKLRRQGYLAKSLTLSLKTNKVLSKSYKFVQYLNCKDTFLEVSKFLLDKVYNGKSSFSYIALKAGGLVKVENFNKYQEPSHKIEVFFDSNTQQRVKSKDSLQSICPICKKIIQTGGFLSRFNRHIDKCLTPNEHDQKQERMLKKRSNKGPSNSPKKKFKKILKQQNKNQTKIGNFFK